MKLIYSLVLLTSSVPASYGATQIVNNIPFIATCPAQYATIQAAVNAAAPGDLIYVCASPNAYNEQVTISKALSVVGQTGARLVPNPMIANTTSLSSGGPIAAAILVTGATNVVISNLIVDGSQSQIAGCAPNLIGVYYRNASGTIAFTAVRGFKLGLGLEGCQSGLGIFAQSASPGTSNVTAYANSIHDFQKNGITANEVGTTLSAANNVVVGLGPTPNIAQNGIQIGFGAGGNLSGNTVTNLIYSQCTAVATCTDSSTGILLYQPAGSVTTYANNIGTTQTGVYYFSVGNGTIRNNNIFNTLVFDGIFIGDDGATLGNGNSVFQNTITNSAEAAVFVSTSNNSVNDNLINEAPIGIWFSGGTGNSANAGNKYYNTPIAVQNGPTAVASRSRVRVVPVR